MSYKLKDIPIHDKPFLTVAEAASYFNLGATKLSQMIKEPGCPFVLRNGGKTLIKKDVLYEYMMKSEEI